MIQATAGTNKRHRFRAIGPASRLLHQLLGNLELEKEVNWLQAGSWLWCNVANAMMTEPEVAVCWFEVVTLQVEWVEVQTHLQVHSNRLGDWDLSRWTSVARWCHDGRPPAHVYDVGCNCWQLNAQSKRLPTRFFKMATLTQPWKISWKNFGTS